MQIRSFLLERYYARHEFTTRFQLSASDCEALTIEEVLQLGGVPAEELLRLPLGYTETRGNAALRAAIARSYPGCAAEDVLVCNAPQEAIYLAMHALLGPGERVVVLTPCYQSLKEVARSIGSEVVEWPLLERQRAWSLDLERLDELLRGATLLVTNAPHNPTGFQPSAAEWRRISELVVERGVRWFSDEMYRGLEPRPELALEPAASIVPGAVSLWGASKSFGPERLVWLPPSAGPVGLVRLRDGSADELAERVRVEGDALLVPATLFDLDDSHVRIGLGRASFPAALERWERCQTARPRPI